jgi:hypothetical protein
MPSPVSIKRLRRRTPLTRAGKWYGPFSD